MLVINFFFKILQIQKSQTIIFWIACFSIIQPPNQFYLSLRFWRHKGVCVLRMLIWIIYLIHQNNSFLFFFASIISVTYQESPHVKLENDSLSAKLNGAHCTCKGKRAWSNSIRKVCQCSLILGKTILCTSSRWNIQA